MIGRSRWILAAAAVSLATPLSACATAGDTAPASAPHNEAAPVAVVEAFSAALRAGDATAVQRLMAPHVIIAESGGVERSFAEYAGHHMPGDMAFTAAVAFTLQQRDVIVEGDMATVISRSEVHGQYRERQIRSNSMETMVLRRTNGQWRIVHIHWSSSPISGAS